MSRSIDECRARGCGGLLYRVGTHVTDGEITHCTTCGRAHTFLVPHDGADAIVVPARKPRSRRGATP